MSAAFQEESAFRDRRRQRRLKHLCFCQLDHGAPGNAARVYGHAVRTCIRLFGSDNWVYDPRWEDRHDAG